MEVVSSVEVIRLLPSLQMVTAMVTTEEEVSPVIFFAEMVYWRDSVSAVGVPMTAPVAWSMLRPAGSSGCTVKSV